MKHRPRFFLSHNTLDKPLVLPVDQVLKAVGLSVWTDTFEIKSGESLITKIFDEGLQKSDYVCAFITKNSARSKWVKKELNVALTMSINTGKPKIILLQFDKAKIPPALIDLRHSPLERHELSEIVREITSSANITLMNPDHTPIPFAANDFHDAISMGGITYLLAGRQDDHDFDPFFDPEGISFKRRHLYVLRIDTHTKEIRYHYLTKARPTHTAMRVVGGSILIFINDKIANNVFEMEGRLFTLHADTLQSNDVHSVFSGHNWGFDPVIDDLGRIHHKDFETQGNPVRINDGDVETQDWHDLAAEGQAWRSAHCPFETKYGPGRETGYLRYLDVPPATFSGLKKH